MYQNIKRRLPLIGIAVIVALLILLFVFSNDTYASDEIRSVSDAAAYLSDFGWEIEPQPVSVRQVEIPAKFSEIYEEYNDLQKSQGFDDLSQYRSMTATVYTFRILNHPTTANVFANVLVIDGTVIAGDVVSYAIDGFLTGLDKVTD